MRGRAKQRKMRAQFHASWLIRVLRPVRAVARRIINGLNVMAAAILRGQASRRDEYVLTGGPGGRDA